MRWIFILWVALGLGCALQEPPVGTPIEGVRTSMETGDTLFPIPKSQRHIYVKVIDSSYPPFGKLLKRELSAQLASKGFTIVNEVNRADILIELQVVFNGLNELDYVQDVFLQGYEGATFPAGGIATSKHLYLKTAAQSQKVLAVIADMTILQKNSDLGSGLKQYKAYSYRARLLSTYENQVTLDSFNEKMGLFSTGMSQYISALF